MAIQEVALAKGLLERAIPIKPITSTAYPTPAKRPAYSVLDESKAVEVFGMEARHWRAQLQEMLHSLSKAEASPR